MLFCALLCFFRRNDAGCGASVHPFALTGTSLRIGGDVGIIEEKQR